MIRRRQYYLIKIVFGYRYLKINSNKQKPKMASTVASGELRRTIDQPQPFEHYKKTFES